MTEPVENPPSPTGAHPQQLQKGTVLSGRFHVGDALASSAHACVYEGMDLGLRRRRVALVVVAGEDREAAAEAWVAIDNPWTAPLLDVVAVQGRIVAVFELDADATLLEDAAGLSREQRAGVLADLSEVMGRAARVPGARACGPGLVWVEGLPRDAHVRVLPVVETGDSAAATDADRVFFGGACLSQLYGVDPDAFDETALAALPITARAFIAPLVGDDPAVRANADVSPFAVRAAFNVVSGASRVPVLSVAPNQQALVKRVSTANERHKRTTAYEVTGAILLLAALVGLGRTLLLGPTDDVGVYATGDSAPLYPEAVEAVEASHARAIDVPLNVRSPESSIWPPMLVGVYYTANEFGPIPSPMGHIGTDQEGVDDIPIWSDAVRIHGEPERPYRIEYFSNAGQFEGFTRFTYDEDSRQLVEIVEHSSTGVVLETTTFNEDFDALTQRSVTGAYGDYGCHTVRFELDSEGRFTERECRNADGSFGVFASGGSRLTFAYEDDEATGQTTVVIRSVDADGEPQNSAAPTREDTYDPLGRVVSSRWFDPAGGPVTNASIGAHERRVYYEEFARTTRYLGVDGAAVVGGGGWHRELLNFSSSGGLLQQRRYDVENNLIEPSQGIANILHEVDERGMIVRTAYLDRTGEATTNRVGVALKTFQRDDHGNVVLECHYDRAENRILSAALKGAHCLARYYDVDGFYSGESYYDADTRAPMRNTLARVERVHVTRDAQRRIHERRYYTSQWSPDVTWAGYHGVRYTYDEFGRESSYEYIDQDGGLARPSNGVARVELERDAQGREIRRCFFSPVGNPTVLVTGFGVGAACFDTRFEDDRIAEISYTDMSGEPVLVQFDGDDWAAALTFEYDASGDLTRQEFLDTAGKRLQARSCLRTRQCIGYSGWSWHVP